MWNSGQTGKDQNPGKQTCAEKEKKQYMKQCLKNAQIALDKTSQRVGVE